MTEAIANIHNPRHRALPKAAPVERPVEKPQFVPAPASAATDVPVVEAYVGVVRHRHVVAFWAGAVAGTFLQTFGVAHLLNGKVKRGLLYLLAGWLLWLPTTVLLLTSGIGLLVWLPMHVYLTYTNADVGSKLATTPELAADQ